MAEHSFSKLACFLFHRISCTWALFLLADFLGCLHVAHTQPCDPSKAGAQLLLHHLLWSSRGSWSQGGRSEMVPQAAGSHSLRTSLSVHGQFSFAQSANIQEKRYNLNRVQIKWLTGTARGIQFTWEGVWQERSVFLCEDCLEGCLGGSAWAEACRVDWQTKQSQCCHRAGCAKRSSQDGHKKGRTGCVAQGAWITKSDSRII